jgi:small subunit ribosomal protein S21
MKNNNHNKYNKNYKEATKGGESDSRDSSTHSEAIQAVPLEVKVYGNNFEKALKAFRALVQKEKILSDYKDKQVYEKPSDRRRRKRNEVKRKLLETENTNSESKRKVKKDRKIVVKNTD